MADLHSPHADDNGPRSLAADIELHPYFEPEILQLVLMLRWQWMINGYPDAAWCPAEAQPIEDLASNAAAHLDAKIEGLQDLVQHLREEQQETLGTLHRLAAILAGEG